MSEEMQEGEVMMMKRMDSIGVRIIEVIEVLLQAAFRLEVVEVVMVYDR